MCVYTLYIYIYTHAHLSLSNIYIYIYIYILQISNRRTRRTGTWSRTRKGRSAKEEEGARLPFGKSPVKDERARKAISYEGFTRLAEISWLKVA